MMLFSLLCNYIKGQDPVFSQLLLNKNYINPAYAGYSGDFSFDMQSRIQWLRVPSYFATNSFSVNAGCSQSRLGFSLQGLNDVRGEGFLQNNQITGAVSVNIPGYLSRRIRNKLFKEKRVIFSTGLSLGAGQRFLNWDRLTFTDQLDVFLGKISQQSLVNPQNEASNIIIDMSAGSRAKVEMGNRGSYLSGGFAVFHINRPVESFLNSNNRVPLRYTGHTFIHLQTEKFLNNPQFVSIGWVGNYQQELQTNILLVMRDFGLGFMLGAGWRSERIYIINRTFESILLQFNLRKGNVFLNYSFDITMSSLGIHRTFGTHEIGISYLLDGYNLCNSRKIRKRKGGDCFYLNDDMNNKSNFSIFQL